MASHEQQTEELIQKLRQSEERSRTICENAPVMIDQFDEHGRCLLWNRECERRLGYSREEIEASDDPLTLCYPDSEERNRALASIRRADGVFREYRVRAKDGRQRIQLWADFLLPNGERISVGHDVTEQRETEAQLRQSQKMEALGQLTGGMAHDFNNLLTVVLANAELLRSLEPSSEEARGSIAEIIDAATRGASLIRKLLTFSRNEELTLEPVDANAALLELRPAIERLLPASIRVRLHTEPTIPPITADQGALEQSLLNLVTNARDAMGGAGVLTLAVERRWVDDGQARSWHCRPGEYVAIVVGDDGEGMTDEVLAHLFEPFFTTKEHGGTGLGMAMVHGLMAQQRGTVRVESVPGEGTRVHLLFPIGSPDAARPPSSPPSTRTVLLVEDEAAIRRVASAVLTRGGYSVEEAPNGERALDLLRAGRHFDLVLCDLVMPAMGGVTLLDEADRLPQRPPFLFVTGYAADDVLARVGNRAVGLLRKPYRADELLNVVAQALGDDAPASS